jgi:hypothetical protein
VVVGFKLQVMINILSISANYIHVRCGPCPHRMVRPRVADGG